MKTLKYSSIAISAIASVSSAYLVYNEIFSPPFCPRLLGIPACFPVLILYLVTLILAFQRNVRSHVMYFISAGTGLGIAIWFSVQSLSGAAQCPTLFSIPIPLCYASFFTFLILILLRRMTTGNRNREQSIRQ
jgi:hypothetical protein